VVTFFSRGTVEGEGFVFAFQRLIDRPNEFTGNHLVISDSPVTRLDYPGEGVYQQSELSAFVYVPEFKGYEEDFDSVQANFTLKGLDDSCNCCDYIGVYLFYWALRLQFVDT